MQAHSNENPKTCKLNSAGTVRPVPIAFTFENIPAEPKAIPQWVCWRYEFRKGKWTKPPFSAHTGEFASSTDSATWADYETAVAAYCEGGFDGIGFALEEDLGLVGVDLDHCIDARTHSIEPWATKIIDQFDSYTEASPSGTGVRIFLKGKLPPDSRHKKGNIEIYSSGRYLTVTGRVLKAYQVRTIEPRQAELDAFLADHFPEPKKAETSANGNGNASVADHEILERALKAKNGAKVTALLNGDVSGYPSQSEAELALCCLLAFYTQDTAQIDRLYRGSKLFRDKWDEKRGADTYGARTIDKAISGKPEKAPEFVSSLKETELRRNEIGLQTWAEFVATDHGSAPFTVEGIAPDCGLVAFHGRGKAGKTTLLIHAARAVATGEPFLDRATTPKPVVYLNYEMGFAYLKELLTAGGVCPENAFILNRPEPVLQVMTIESLMQQVGTPGVVIIDSFRGAFRLAGDAENSAGGAGLILRNIQDIAVKHNWLIFVVHHSNRGQLKGTDGVSGTSDWIAAPDVIWTWQRPDKTKPGVLHIEGRMPPVDPLAVDLSPERCLFTGSVEENQREIDNNAILNTVTEEGQPANVIAGGINRPASTVHKRCEALFEDGQLNRAGEGKRGDPYMYSKVSSHINLLREETNRKNENGHDEGGFDWANGEQKGETVNESWIRIKAEHAAKRAAGN